MSHLLTDTRGHAVRDEVRVRKYTFIESTPSREGGVDTVSGICKHAGSVGVDVSHSSTAK